MNHNHNDHHKIMMQDFIKRFWVSAVLTLPILALSPLIAELLNYTTFIDFAGSRELLFVLSSIVFIYGGKPFLSGIYYELKDKNPGMMSLIAIAITVAYLYSSAVVFGLPGELFFWELTTLIDVMLIGHYLEMRSTIGASKALEELTRLLPASAHKVIGKNKTKNVPLSQLAVGDAVLIKPGEKIPADGVVKSGESAVNEAILTGEAKPVFKTAGAKVIGGSINFEGSLVVTISKLGEDSFIAQVVKLVREAQSSKSKTQDLANKAARWLTVVGVGGGLLTFGYWAVVNDAVFAIERAVTVMVIACPHALGVAIPLVVAVSTAKSARAGLLVKKRQGFENLRKIDSVVFDKTGTLTHGKFELNQIMLNPGFSEPDIKQLAASLESLSQHPIAVPVANLASDKLQVEQFKSLSGQGVQGKINGQQVAVVSPGYIKRQKLSLGSLNLNQLEEGGATVVLVLVQNKVAAAISLADKIRDEAKQAITNLKKAGIDSYMLTGDNKQVAASVAKALGIKDYFAEVMPADKSKKIKELQARGRYVAMVGDGVNDAPALATADVGIAIGAGTDVAAETADVILVKSNPGDVMMAVKYAKATYRKMRQNLFWATGYNVVAIPLAAGVLINVGVVISPAVGAAFMSLSTVIVAINAKFLRI